MQNLEVAMPDGSPTIRNQKGWVTVLALQALRFSCKLQAES